MTVIVTEIGELTYKGNNPKRFYIRRHIFTVNGETKNMMKEYCTETETNFERLYLDERIARGAKIEKTEEKYDNFQYTQYAEFID